MNPLDLILARNFNIWNYATINSRERAVAAAQAWLLLPTRTPRCSRCRNLMHRENRSDNDAGFRWRCRRNGCNIIVSPLKNTFFEKSHLSILKTLRLIYHFFVKDDVTRAAIEVGVSRKSAIQIYHFLREVCEITESHDRQMIGGQGDIVEVDETHLFTNKYHRGRLLQRQTWSFGCISRLTKKIHVELIQDKSRPTLDAIINANVRPSSYIMSDMHRAYHGVDLRLNMAGHSTVNHRQQFVAGTIDIPVDLALGSQVGNLTRVKIHTNNIERQWRELKKHTRSCRSQQRLKWYMGEYMYRHNILRPLPSDAARFRRLLRDIHRVYPGYRKRGIRLSNCRCQQCRN